MPDSREVTESPLPIGEEYDFWQIVKINEAEKKHWVKLEGCR